MSIPWTCLLHGDAGVGKSWLGGTTPTPRLILDAEGRAHFIPSELPKVQWDPTRESPPVDDGTWDTCIVHISKFDLMQTVFQWIQSGQHPFKSATIDSLMEIQKRFIDQLVGMEQLQTQHWGDVLRHLEGLVRSFRDTAPIPSNPLDVVIFTVGTKEDEGKKRPLLQGALRETLPYYLDTVGYLYVTNENGVAQRNLLVQPTQQIVAKDGTGRLGGPVLVNPNLTELYDSLGGA